MTQPRILIVDKDHASADALARLLGEHGYEAVGPAASCREALETVDA